MRTHPMYQIEQICDGDGDTAKKEACTPKSTEARKGDFDKYFYFSAERAEATRQKRSHVGRLASHMTAFIAASARPTGSALPEWADA
jgi:hypothetical protein